MKLLPENNLIWSPVVANSRMNRERNSSGINSYEQEFKFKPESFLEEKITQFGKASWLDLCCGHGKALIQTADYFHKKKLQDRIKLKGVDLIGDFMVPASAASIKFESKSVTEFVSQEKHDLITCVHGLHYLGDKLKVIQTAANLLNSSGLFIANLDLNNIVINGADTNSFLKGLFREKGLNYNPKTKLLKRIDAANIHFALKYLGADDSCGPNYTGQESVTSYYSV